MVGTLNVRRLNILSTPSPVFFVSVASKGFSYTVSLLFATLTGRSVSVAGKGLKRKVGSDSDMVGAGQRRVPGERKDRD
jgi:hypothetical protein